MLAEEVWPPGRVLLGDLFDELGGVAVFGLDIRNRLGDIQLLAAPLLCNLCCGESLLGKQHNFGLRPGERGRFLEGVEASPDACYAIDVGAPDASVVGPKVTELGGSPVAGVVLGDGDCVVGAVVVAEATVVVQELDVHLGWFIGWAVDADVGDLPGDTPLFLEGECNLVVPLEAVEGVELGFGWLCGERIVGKDWHRLVLLGVLGWLAVRDLRRRR